jgi:hypothetical protein
MIRSTLRLGRSRQITFAEIARKRWAYLKGVSFIRGLWECQTRNVANHVAVGLVSTVAERSETKRSRGLAVNIGLGVRNRNADQGDLSPQRQGLDRSAARRPH